MKQRITPGELNDRLKWPVEEKIKHAIYTFLEYYIYFKGNVYLSFSGGKDSQTLAWIIDEIFKGKWELNVKVSLIEILNLDSKEAIKDAYQQIIIEKKYGEVPFVFCDTGLEFPEIRKHVKSYGDRVVWMKPLMKFPEVIRNIGVAVVSKKIAEHVRRLKQYLGNPNPKNEATRNLYMTGIKKDGSKSKQYKLPEKWKKLIYAPFKVSEKCCDIFKKEPWKRYGKETGRKGITATTVVESMQRRNSYLLTGCNTFDKGGELSRPLSIFTEKDVWLLSEQYGFKFCEVYYDRIFNVPDGNGGFFEVLVKAEQRTGCMFCLFGIHLEPKDKPNRFQRMAITHPKQYQFMINECGLGKVLDFIGVKYKADLRQFNYVKNEQLKMF